MARKTLTKPDQDVEDRFWMKVKMTEDDCWLWQAATRASDGIGVFGIGGQTFYAHRIAFVIARGPIPEGMDVRRTCSNVACVRPLHLVLVPSSCVGDTPPAIQ